MYHTYVLLYQTILLRSAVLGAALRAVLLDPAAVYFLRAVSTNYDFVII